MQVLLINVVKLDGYCFIKPCGLFLDGLPVFIVEIPEFWFQLWP